MAKQRNAVRVGIFMLASVALVIFVIIAISGASRFLESFQTYRVAFTLQDDIGGLRAGDDVRIGGLKVGDIRAIEVGQAALDGAAPAPAVLVSIYIPAKYALSRDAHVFVQRGLTGTAAINIDNLGSGPPAATGELLRGEPDSVTGLLHTLAALQPDLRQVVTNFKTGSAKLNTDLDKLGGTLDTIHQWFGPSTGDFHQVVANLRDTTGDLRERLPDLLDRMRGILTKADSTLTRASASLSDIQSGAVSARQAAGALRSLLMDNRAKFGGIISSLKETTDNLKYASMEIRHSPWRLLYQPKPDEMSNLNIYDSVRQFAEGANSLDDAASALRDLLNDPNADPAQVKKLMDHLDDSFGKFQQVQQKLWQDVKQ